VSGTAPGLIVDSVTGIEVTLPLAGAGARSFAFVIDWHIRLLLALAWYTAAALLYNGRLSLAPPLVSEARWFGFVVAPAMVIYFLYHLVLEPALRGRTPGKRMAGVRLVTRDGGAPEVGALLVRNVFRLIDSLPVFYGLGLTLVVLTREHVRCGDMAAGTVLVYERPGSDLSLPQPLSERMGGLDPESAEIVAELLQRWPTLTPAARSHLARQVLARYGSATTDLAALREGALREQLEELTRPREGVRA
jgi:uncharacterized RDD family membrane protein YckC